MENFSVESERRWRLRSLQREVFSAMMYWMDVKRRDKQGKEERTASGKAKRYLGT